MRRALILLLVCCGSAAAFVEKQNIREAHSGVQELIVDNVNGLVEVTGYDGTQVLVEGVRTDKAESAEKLAEARRDVRLETTWPSPGVLKLSVDGPFRERNNGHRGDPGYEVRYDITVKVPRETRTQLKTVNGTVRLRDTSGKFTISSVNGTVQASGVGGTGEAKTVNGTVRVEFVRNPGEAMAFKTVNGAIEVSLRAGLNADVRAKTLNGGIYTDFPATLLANAPGAGERKNGKFVYQRDRTQRVRIGAGGPEISCETVNGDVRILEGK